MLWWSDRKFLVLVFIHLSHANRDVMEIILSFSENLKISCKIKKEKIKNILWEIHCVAHAYYTVLISNDQHMNWRNEYRYTCTCV